MSLKPVVLIYDIDNALVDDVAAEVGLTGLYTTINTYNEANAMDALHQYNRGFGLLSNKLSCIISGWNGHRKPREQFLYRVRAEERRSPFRRPTPFIIVTEDHRSDLKTRALDPKQGAVCAYLDREDFKGELAEVLRQVVYSERASALNAAAWSALREQAEPAESV